MTYTIEALRELNKLQTKILAVTLASDPDHSYTEWEIAQTLKQKLPAVMKETSKLISSGYLRRKNKTVEVR